MLRKDTTENVLLEQFNLIRTGTGAPPEQGIIRVNNDAAIAVQMN